MNMDGKANNNTTLVGGYFGFLVLLRDRFRDSIEDSATILAESSREAPAVPKLFSKLCTSCRFPVKVVRCSEWQKRLHDQPQYTPVLI